MSIINASLYFVSHKSVKIGILAIQIIHVSYYIAISILAIQQSIQQLYYRYITTGVAKIKNV